MELIRQQRKRFHFAGVRVIVLSNTANSKNKRALQSRKKPGSKSKRRSSERLSAKFATVAEMALWPVLGCYMSERWGRPEQLTQIAFARGSQHGYVGIAVLLVDLQCLGVKDAFVRRTGFEGFAGLLERLETADSLTEAEPEIVVKVVDHAVAYARQYGFEPHGSFANARKLIGDVDTSDCTVKVPCGGEGGKPLYLAGPRDNTAAILCHLEERCGPDGFEFISPMPS